MNRLLVFALVFFSGAGISVCIQFAWLHLYASASESKEKSNVNYIAGLAIEYSYETGGRLPQSISELSLKWMQLGRDDRSLVAWFPGSHQLENVSSLPDDFLRYGIASKPRKAVVYQKPDTDERRDMVWQTLRNDQEYGWVPDGHPESGTYAELVEIVLEVTSDGDPDTSSP